MSLDTSESFRSIADKILLKPIGRAMANPLSLALMITVVIMLIVRFTYDEEHMFRTTLRVFGVCTLFLFINNHVLIKDMNSRQLNPDQQNVIRTLERGRTSGGYPSAMPAAGGTVASSSNDADSDESYIISKPAGSSGNILERLPDASSLVVRTTDA